MTFQTLQGVLADFNHNQFWQTSQHFQQILACWNEIVGIPVAAQTRPTKIDRQTLKVATSNAVWAQNLQFERHRIVEKLNQRLCLNLVDIHFSTALWSKPQPLSLNSLEQQKIWQQHPCRIVPPDHSATMSKNAQKSRSTQPPSQGLAPCPQCRCLTPVGELERWSVCAFCVVEQWA